VDHRARALRRAGSFARVPARLAVLILLLFTTACTATDPTAGARSTAPEQPAHKRVVGYYTGWGTYARDFQVRDLHAGGAADRLTHLLYAFGRVDDGRCVPGDAFADFRKPVPDGLPGSATPAGNIGELRKLKALHPRLKVLWSFGGWTGSAGFAQAAKEPAAFAESCHRLLDDPRWAGVFDGIDIDWEYPNACGRTCDRSGRAALSELLAALRSRFGLVTAAVPGDVGKLDATDYAAAARHADWLNAMTYDFAGTDGKPGRTAAHSPLSVYPGMPRPAATAASTVDKLLALGVPADRILLGIGFYGRGWAGVRSAQPGAAGTGPAPGTYEEGLEDYRVLSRRCPPTGVIGGTAYAACGDQWWSYDTPETIRTKMAYARSKALGGAFAWELSGDTADAALLTAMATGLAGG
jgi:chitinase